MVETPFRIPNVVLVLEVPKRPASFTLLCFRVLKVVSKSVSFILQSHMESSDHLLASQVPVEHEDGLATSRLLRAALLIGSHDAAKIG